ncbi:hypothetical protein IC216_20400 [Clostridioides sp. ES-S-0145-01]|uniref:hypothetical protein n=1 Tax=Clostridioides sp. ES-S-0145-01 TaxID=2770784 RepID=UPI001D0F9D18|nr:hypothetical protein [Clostridioides sp. ES-S-0145-01]
MRLNITQQNTIEIENSKKEDVYFVIVGEVFFERHGNTFNNITNNNVDNYEVEVLPTDNINLELKITSSRNTNRVYVIVEDKQYNHGAVFLNPTLKEEDK